MVGGIAARHDVTLEVLDDLQLALDSLLEHDEADDGEVSVVLRVGDDTIDVSVGPVGERTAAELGRRTPARRSACAGCSTRPSTTRRVSERDGGAWVELRKGFVAGEAQA